MRVGNSGLHRTLGLLAGLGLLLAATSAHAASIAYNLMSLSGPGQVRVTLDDSAIPGAVKLTAEIVAGDGNIRGIFFNLADSDFASVIGVSGDDVVAVGNGVSSLGGGLDFFGADSPCPCDFGVAVGGPFAALTATMLTLSSPFPSVSLSISDFLEFGVLADGDDFGQLVSGGDGEMVIPEPGTASLVALGLFGLASLRRRALG